MVNEIIYLQDLANISSTGSYILMNNLDFNSDSSYDQTDPDWQAKKTAWTTGEGWAPLMLTENGGNFGSLDGNEFTISNLFINRPTTDGVGLFGAADWCTIKDIGLLNVNVTGKDNVGALCGWAESVISIEKSYSTGSVTGSNYVGGLLGVSESNNIDSEVVPRTGINNCYSQSSVVGVTYVGGFVGENSGSTYNGCFYDTETSMQTGDTKGVGKTTTQMKTQSTFTDWEIPPWYFYVNEYPSLTQQITNTSGVINMGYFYDVSGNTSEVKASIIQNKITKTVGYFVGQDGQRYILGRR